MKTKLLKIGMGASSLLCLTPIVSCQQIPNFNFIGAFKEYVPTYACYTSQSTVNIHQTLKIYMDSPNHKEMLTQDFINTINAVYQPFGDDTKYGYYFEIHDVQPTQAPDSFVLSYYFSVYTKDWHDQWRKILEAEVNNLRYSIFKDPYDESNSNEQDFDMYFSPVYTHVNDHVMYVEDEFWEDPSFEIKLNEWDIEGKNIKWFIWSVKTTTPADRFPFQDVYAKYFVIYPHYFDEVEIVTGNNTK